MVASIIRQIVYNPAIREMALKWWHRTPEPHPGLESIKNVIDDILVELKIRQWANPMTDRLQDKLGEAIKKFADDTVQFFTGSGHPPVIPSLEETIPDPDIIRYPPRN